MRPRAAEATRHADAHLVWLPQPLTLLASLLVAFALATPEARAAAPPPEAIQAAIDVGRRVMPTPCEPAVLMAEFDRAHSARADLESCAIHLNALDDWGWLELCGVMVHERGHIAGLPHSEDPRSFMHAQILNVHPACFAAAPSMLAPRSR